MRPRVSRKQKNGALQMSSKIQVWVGRWRKNTWRRFFLPVLNPHLSRNSLALCDSWSGLEDEQVLLEASGRKDVDLKIIPPKTSKYAQPLYVYFFWQYKIYAKRMTNFIKLRSSNLQPKLHDRFFIVKLHSDHGRLARWRRWNACDVAEATERALLI